MPKRDVPGKFPVPDKNATMKASIIGLAVCCFNVKYTDPKYPARKGRWEVAIPRIKGHVLTIDLGQPGILQVSEKVKTIEFKDRTGVFVPNPKNEEKPFHRLRPETNDPLDYRWLADFSEITQVSAKAVSRVKTANVTMLYVYDATFYSRLDNESGEIVVASQEDTGQVVADSVHTCPEYHTGPVLDDTHPIGFIAAKALADVHSPGKRKGIVDILFDGDLFRTYKQGGQPQDIIVQNMEPAPLDSSEKPKDPPGSKITTLKSHYGRGDFYRYFELFQVPEEKKVHVWEKRERFPLNAGRPIGEEPARTGDCNGIRMDGVENLGDFFK